MENRKFGFVCLFQKTISFFLNPCMPVTLNIFKRSNEYIVPIIAFSEKKFVIKLLFIFFIERFRYWTVVKDLLETVKAN